MKLPNTIRLLRSKFFTYTIAILSIVISSCNSAIYDNEGDCSVHYRVHFRYTKNVLDSDAFGSQVSVINLAVYDKEGNMVLHKTAHRIPTTENDFYIEVDLVPGKYDMLAWCEGESVGSDAISFALGGQKLDSKLQMSEVSLPLVAENGFLVSGKDLNRLYHGLLEDVEIPDAYGIVDIGPIYLVKDTNHLSISLQNMDGTELDYKILSVELEGGNSHRLDWKNHPVGDICFFYRPWIVTPYCAMPTPDTKTGGETINGMQTEITTSRIMADREQMLTVRRTDTGAEIFSIPLVKYLLLVRSHYDKATSNQDYFDRVDDFNMVFYLQGMTWVKTRILINGWRVVPPQTGIID